MECTFGEGVSVVGECKFGEDVSVVGECKFGGGGAHVWEALASSEQSFLTTHVQQKHFRDISGDMHSPCTVETHTR